MMKGVIKAMGIKDGVRRMLLQTDTDKIIIETDADVDDGLKAGSSAEFKSVENVGVSDGIPVFRPLENVDEKTFAIKGGEVEERKPFKTVTPTMEDKLYAIGIILLVEALELKDENATAVEQAEVLVTAMVAKLKKSPV